MLTAFEKVSNAIRNIWQDVSRILLVDDIVRIYVDCEEWEYWYPLPVLEKTRNTCASHSIFLTSDLTHAGSFFSFEIGQFG